MGAARNPNAMFANREHTPQRAAQKAANGHRSAKPGRARYDSATFLQRHLGNHRFRQLTATGRPVLQRACACGGTCAHCSGHDDEAHIQTKLTVGPPNDRYEQEADHVADQVMRMPEPQVQRQAAVEEEPEEDMLQTKPLAAQITPLVQRKTGTQQGTPAPFSVDDMLRSSGRPLGAATRSFMEPRFGMSFGSVRLHTGAGAERTAAQLQARAFTYGQDIWLGRGASESDRRLMAHELAHTIQQGGASTGKEKPISERQRTSSQFPSIQHVLQAGAVVQRLEADMCASNRGTCNTPEGADGEKGTYRLTVYADKEGPFLGIPATHKVGHSWVRLTDTDGNYWSYGFWPQVGFDPENTSDNVEGCVHSPDGRAGDPPHSPTSSQSFELTAKEFAAAHAYAIGVCNSNPKYNLFGLQCTEFALRVLEAAGQSPSLGFGLIWESPNALDSWIRSNAFLLGIGITGATSGPGAGEVGLDLAYMHQFYSVLGNKLRLHWTNQGELSKRRASVSTGLGAELTSQRVFLPSLYVFGGGIAGELTPGKLGSEGEQFGAGLTTGAGLLFDIDEIATVGVEYNLVKDFVTNDPVLNRLMISASLRLF